MFWGLGTGVNAVRRCRGIGTDKLWLSGPGNCWLLRIQYGGSVKVDNIIIYSTGEYRRCSWWSQLRGSFFMRLVQIAGEMGQ